MRSLFYLTPLLLLFALAACDALDSSDTPSSQIPSIVDAKGGNNGGGGNEPGAGNNLSFPVIWAEGVTKVLRVPPGGVPLLNDTFVWWWGLDADDNPLTCAPDPDDENRCDDGIEDQATGDPPPTGAYKAYLQKEDYNIWQAGNESWAGTPVNIDVIDWGDDLESKPWYLNSQVRIENVLFKTLTTPMTEYGMVHTSGWGIDEVWGLQVDPLTGPVLGPGTEATVFSPCARLTIQRLTVPRDDPAVDQLVWDPVTHQWTGAQINAPIFNMAVHEAQDGPGYYNAEVNVKGTIIFGYTWGVRRLNQGVADYRLTFSLDQTCGSAGAVNTFITADTIIKPSDETEADDGGGGVGVLRPDLNLTYMDVRILQKSGGRPR